MSGQGGNETVYRFNGDVDALLKELAAARAAMKLTGDDAKKAGARIDDGLKQAGKAAESAGKAAKFTRQEMLTLNYTLSDVAAQLATGTSPFTILLQQGGQVKDAFGGIGPLFSKLGSIFTVARVAAAGLAAGIGTVAFAAIAGYRENTKLEQSLLMTGNRAGINAEQFGNLSRSVEQFANVTRGAARDAVQEVVSTGAIGSQAIGAVSTAVAIYAKRSGQSAEDVAKDFARMRDGAAKFAAEKNRSLNFLTVAQFKYIQSLEAGGKAEQAQAEVARLLTEHLAPKLRSELGLIERSWDGIRKAASKAWDAMKDIGRPETLADQLETARKRLENTGRRGGTGRELGGNSTAAAAREAVEALREQQRFEGQALRDKSESAAEAAKDIERQQKGAIEAGIALQRAGYTSAAAVAEYARQKELSAVELQFDQQAVSFGEYVARRNQLEQAGIDARLKALGLEISLERQRAPTDENETIAQKAKLVELESRRYAIMADQFRLEEAHRNSFGKQPRDVAESAASALRKLEIGQSDAVAQALSDRRAVALRGSAELVAQTRAMSADLIQDERARGQALIAIEVEHLRKRMDLGALTGEERKAAEDALANWIVKRNEQLNEQLKPSWQRMVEGWRDTTRLMREASDSFMTGMLRTGEDAYVQLGKTGKLELKGMLDFAMEEMLRLQYKQVVHPMVEKGAGFLAGLIGIKSPAAAGAAPGADPAALAAKVAQEQMTMEVGKSAVAFQGLESLGLTPATTALGKMLLSIEAASAALDRMALSGGGGAGGSGSFWEALFSGSGGGGAGAGTDYSGMPDIGMYAKSGAAFNLGVQQFAKGDAFTNKVFNSPQLFRFGKGGANLGMLGEAGDEGVLPLKRGPGGRLGVSLYGAGVQRSGTPAAPTIKQTVNYYVSTGVSPAQMAAALDANNQNVKAETMQSMSRGGDMRKAIEAY